MVVIPIYWFCALWLLFRFSPIFVDGSGATASFYWGNHLPAATLSDYQRIPAARLRFLYPYWYGSTIITLVGCVLAPWILQIINSKKWHLFTASLLTTLCLLLITMGIADLGTALHIWIGPMMYISLSSTFVGLKVMIPMSILAGLVLVLRNRIHKRGIGPVPHCNSLL